MDLVLNDTEYALSMTTLAAFRVKSVIFYLTELTNEYKYFFFSPTLYQVLLL